MGNSWTEKDAWHLLGRATFYADEESVSAALKLGKEETVRRLLAGEPLKERAVSRLLPFDQLQIDGKPLKTDDITDQQMYWLHQMVEASDPLREKMTLFWHGHFATSYQKVREIPLILKQQELLRKEALASFKNLVLGIGKDPAMMLYLDLSNSRKERPNENYSREVMELFTLGIGNYTEQDVKEGARSLTGWVYQKDKNEVLYKPKQHDDGLKLLLGEAGNFNEIDFVNVLFHQESLPRFVAGKLLRQFATPQPSEAWQRELGQVFKASDFRIDAVLKHLFLSDAFYAEEYRGALVKSPVEYVVGMVKALEQPLSKGYAGALRKMGQELYLPPNVAGWSGGASWLTSANLLARYQFAESVAKKVNVAAWISSPAPTDAAGWTQSVTRKTGLPGIGESTRKALEAYAEDMFVHAPAAKKTNGQRGLLQLALISPEAQMK